MKKLNLISAVLLSLFLILLVSNNISAQGWQWAKSAGGYSYKIAVDDNGNSYLAGTFSDTVLFGSTSLISSGSDDVFLVKYNSSGIVQWALKTGGVHGDYAGGVGVDGAGNVYLAGYFGDDIINGGGGTCTFGNTTLTSAGAADIYLAKYDSSGSLIWVRQGSGTGDDDCNALSVDKAGNCYLTGSFGYDFYNGFGGFNVAFNNVTVNCIGDEDIFVAVYDSSGHILWTEDGQSSPQARALAIESDPSGNVYITGVNFGYLQFGAYSVSGGSFMAANYFVAKCSAFGWQWARDCIGTNTNGGNAICVDDSGNVYVVGDFFDQATFDTILLDAGSGYNSFIAKYNTTGNLQFVKQFTGASNSLTSIKAEPNGSIVFTGNFRDTITYNNQSLISLGHDDFFICITDPLGNIQWIEQEGDTNNEGCNDIALDIYGNIFITGFFKDSTVIGNIPIAKPGQNLFIAKYEQTILGITSLSDQQYSLNIFPNPIIGSTSISFTNPISGNISIDVFDLSGRMIETLVDSYYPAGQHLISWSAGEKDYAFKNGLYFVKFIYNNSCMTKMISIMR